MKRHWLRGLLLSVSMALVLSGAAAAVIYAQNQNPREISCPADVTVECDESSHPDDTGWAVAWSYCYALGLTYTDEAYLTGCNGTGYIERTWTATDDCGSSSCVQIITVVDTTPPVVSSLADVTIECDESSDPSNTGLATATDNCGTPLVTYTDVEYLTGCNGTGYIERAWMATDDCGNSTSGVQIITVDDTTPPVVSSPADVTIECDESSHPANTGWATATDNCGTPSVTYTDVEYLSGSNGTGYIERTWTATDDCGNSTLGVQIITVLEQEFVPEPGSILLLGSGLAGLAGYATLRLRSGQALRWRARE